MVVVEDFASVSEKCKKYFSTKTFILCLWWREKKNASALRSTYEIINSRSILGA